MAGRVSRILDKIIEKRSGGNQTLVMSTKTKLILKGLNPDKFGPGTPDDPTILKKAEALAHHLGITV